MCTKNTALSKTLLTCVMQYKLNKLNSFHVYYNVRHVYVDAYTANYMYIPTYTECLPYKLHAYHTNLL